MTSAPNALTTATIGSVVSELNEAEPWPYYEKVRRSGGVLWDDETNAWLVASYDLVKQIGQADGSEWSTPYLPNKTQRAPFGLDVDTWNWFYGAGSSEFVGLVKDQDRVRQHRWLLRAMSPRVMDLWTHDAIAPVVSHMIDQFYERGRADLCRDLADRVGPQYLASVMALPGDDDEWVVTMANHVDARLRLKGLKFTDDVVPDIAQAAMEATQALVANLTPYVEDRRSGTGDDLVSMMWREGEDLFGAGRWGAPDVVGLVVSIWEAGTHTVRMATANALYLLVNQPALQALLRACRALIPRLVEEALRLYGPVAFRVRVAEQDTVLGPVTIRAGQRVMALLLAAQHDGDRYSCPHEVDLERNQPRDHMAFWIGPRACTGQALARAEMNATIAGVLNRLADVRLDHDAPPPVFSGSETRSWGPLHVTFGLPAAQL